MLTVTAAFGGYVVGNRHGVTTTLEAAGLTDALNSAAAGSSGSAGSSGDDQPHDAASPRTPASATDTPAADRMSVDELVASGKLQPGTMTATPVARADGSYNALIFGPGGPLNTRADILNVHRRDPADPFAVGAVDAPVVISEFSDLECPFCARFRNRTEPVIMDQFVRKGLVRLEFNDMPINGPNAVAAAKAGRAAAAQGKFFQFQEILFSQEKSKNGHPNNTIDDFVRYAAEAGVEDLDAFRADATGEKYSDVVTEARAYGSNIGITGTPGFIVGETFISGAQPTETFVELITDELNKVARGEVVPTTPKDADNK
ncbi:thioredoxin domain-containing protein [Corynebacterium sp. CCM 8862]|uniref:Thioredoxin domain-containing protein n=2 Tax=Corynebacterium mendelii TaxID=2765362 RepID=A0A939E0E1_9CORY|nr:thioredoxin domain-containing protein [Corynebacterium mendelii]MBN9644156.1 thioredoxin domain-containing protein [Corynebacterium mendelii]